MRTGRERNSSRGAAWPCAAATSRLLFVVVVLAMLGAYTIARVNACDDLPATRGIQAVTIMSEPIQVTADAAARTSGSASVISMGDGICRAYSDSSLAVRNASTAAAQHAARSTVAGKVAAEGPAPFGARCALHRPLLSPIEPALADFSVLRR